MEILRDINSDMIKQSISVNIEGIEIKPGKRYATANIIYLNTLVGHDIQISSINEKSVLLMPYKIVSIGSSEQLSLPASYECDIITIGGNHITTFLRAREIIELYKRFGDPLPYEFILRVVGNH